MPSAVTWWSSDARIASVAADGTVTGHIFGTVEIVAAVGTVADTSRVSVPIVHRIHFSVTPSIITLDAGKTVQLNVCCYLEQLPVAWHVSVPAVASVSSDHVLEGLASGFTTIRAAAATGELVELKVTVR